MKGLNNGGNIIVTKKILLVGNGFDIAHGLLTSYNDFLFIMNNWNDFYNLYRNVLQGKVVKDTSKFKKFMGNASDMSDAQLQKLGRIVKENSWAKYYCNCEAEIDGWIDFERELYPVLDLFEEIFNVDYNGLIN